MSSTHSQTSVESSDEKKRSLLVDLRSDTVTKPSPEMRRAMMEAEVGDDVYAEDPTINRLSSAPRRFLAATSIFVPSGTMGNQIAIKIHTRPGQEIICEERAHIKDYEMAMLAHFSGCIPRTIAGENGVMTWEQVRRKIQPSTYYIAQTGLVSLEIPTTWRAVRSPRPKLWTKSAKAFIRPGSPCTWMARAFSTLPLLLESQWRRSPAMWIR